MFEHNPLEQVICQLRFPTILAIATELPTRFQERVRALHPVYRRKSGVELPPGLATALEGIALPAPPEATTHWFETPDGGRSISLGPGFVAVTERNYKNWESFRTIVVDAIDALCECYSPTFFERVGLKYVDVVNRRALGLEETPWSDLLESAVAGISAASPSITADLEGSQTFARFRLDSVDESAVVLQTALTGDDTFVIDADFFTDTRKDRDGVEEALDFYNVEAGRLFRWAIRPSLHAALGQRDQ